MVYAKINYITQSKARRRGKNELFKSFHKTLSRDLISLFPSVCSSALSYIETILPRGAGGGIQGLEVCIFHTTCPWLQTSSFMCYLSNVVTIWSSSTGTLAGLGFLGNSMLLAKMVPADTILPSTNFCLIFTLKATLRARSQSKIQLHSVVSNLGLRTASTMKSCRTMDKILNYSRSCCYFFSVKWENKGTYHPGGLVLC